MSTNEAVRSTADNVLLAVAILILAGSVYSYYYFAEISQLLRVLGVVGAVIVALFVVSQTGVGRTAIAFMAEARTETRKVVWPNRQETMQITMVVVFIVVLVGVVLWGLDAFLGWLVKALLGT